MNKKSGVSPEIMTALPNGGPTKLDESIMIDGSTRLNTGSVNYRIPIIIPKGRKENELSLALEYDSAGNDNSAFGAGWNFPILSVRRRTNKGIPKYDDSDLYILSTGEEILSIGGGQYRSRVESQFRKIQKVADHWEITEKDGTKFTLGEDQDSRIYDMSDNSKIYQWFLSKIEDTNGNIVEYQYVRDDQWKRYSENIYGAQLYLKEIRFTNTDDSRFLNVIWFDYDYSLKNERRPDYWTSYHSGFPIQTNWLCKRIVSFTSNIENNSSRNIDYTTGNNVGPIDPEKYIRYGIFLKPSAEGNILYEEDSSIPDKKGITSTDYGPVEIEFPIPQNEIDLEIFFDVIGQFTVLINKLDGTVEDKTINITTVGKKNVSIADATTYVTSFIIQNTVKPFLIREITLGNNNDMPIVFSRYDLEYYKTIGEETQVNPFSIPSTVKLLKSATRIGYDDSLNEDNLPPVTFEYSMMSTQGIWPRILKGTPNESLKDPNTTLIPFTPTGRVDILQTKDQHVCFLNKGQIGTDIITERKPLIESPTLKLEEVKTLLRDVNSKGSVDISNDTHFYHNPATNTGSFDIDNLKWGTFEDFDSTMPHPQLNPGEMPITRALDVNHSGAIDLLKTGQDFILWRNNGDKTWSAPEVTSRQYSFGDKNWPNVSFDDERIFIADMNNDKLDEIVRVTARKIEYWSQVDGRWQIKTTMKNSPRITDFNPRRVLIRDINEDGFADLIYVHSTGVSIFLNCGGHKFGNEILIKYSDYEISRGNWIPSDADSLEIVDFGSGKGILWSFDRTEVENNYYYLPFSNTIPGLLVAINNGTGGRIELGYSTSTIESINDEHAGQPWESHIPFPLTVIKKINKIDLITNTTETTIINYRNGYYDRDNRELRGFGIVTEKIIGDDSIAGTEIKHFFNNQELSGLSGFELAEARALSGKESRNQVFDFNAGELIKETISYWKALPVYNWTDSGGGNYTPTSPINESNPENSIILPFIKFKLDLAHEGTLEPRYALTENKYELETDPNIPTEFGNLREEVFYGEVLDSGTSGIVATFMIDGQTKNFYNRADNNEQLKKYSYAINRQNHIVGLPSKITTWAGINFDQLIGEERFYYDGGTNRDDRLSLGIVNQGNLQRKETLWMLENKLNGLFENQVVQNLGNNEGQGSGYYLKDTTESGEDGRFIVSERNIFFIDGGKIKYGTVEQSIDARGSGTLFTYDQHKWLTREITNQLDHKKIMEEINYRTNLPTIIKDEDNNSKEKFEYDNFARVIAYYTDYDNHPEPVARFTYEVKSFYNFNDTNKPNYTKIDQVIDDKEVNKRYIQSFKFLDGFNREIQTCESSEANNSNDFVVVSTKYNRKGIKQAESLAYHKTGSDYSFPDFTSKPAKFYEYDALGRITKSLWSDGSFSQKTYFPWGILEYDEEDTDSASQNFNTPKTIYNDAINNVIRIKEILRDLDYASDTDVNTWFIYDSGNSRVEIKNAKNQATIFDLSFTGNTIHINSPDAGERWFLYNASGNLIYSKDAEGNVIWRKYDELSRIKDEILGNDPAAASDVVYQYDDSTKNAVGKLWYVKSLSENFEEWFEYDKRGNRTKREVQISPHGVAGVANKKSIVMEYNTLNLIKSKNYDNGLFIVTNNYGVDGKLWHTGVYFKSIDATKEVIKKIVYQQTGAVDTVDFLDGELIINMSYDPNRLWIRNIKASNRNRDILQDLKYPSIDKIGNIKIVDDETDTVNKEKYSYLYNSLYWIKEAKFESPANSDYDLPYQYDIVGNFVKNGELNEELHLDENYWYHPTNKPNAVRGIDSNHDLLGYDQNGHLIKSDKLKELVWNERGLLRSIKNIAEDHQENYLYNNSGIRTYQKVEKNGVVEEAYYFDENFEMRGAESYLLLLLGDKRIACLNSNGNINFYLTNHIGNVAKYVKEDGNVDASYSEIYTAYGNSSKEPTSTDKIYRFTSGERNVFGLYYFKARYYDARIGRFVSPDPFLYESIQPEVVIQQVIKRSDNFNPYIYGLNNPIIFIDPNGKTTFRPGSRRNLPNVSPSRRPIVNPPRPSQLRKPPARRYEPFTLPEWHRLMNEAAKQMVGLPGLAGSPVEAIANLSDINDVFAADAAISGAELRTAYFAAYSQWMNSNVDYGSNPWATYSFKIQGFSWRFESVSLASEYSPVLSAERVGSITVIRQLFIMQKVEPLSNEYGGGMSHPDFPLAGVPGDYSMGQEDNQE